MSNPNQPDSGTWKRWLWDKSPNLFKRYWGSRFMGTIGFMLDDISEAINDALYAPYLESDWMAPDAVSPLGQEFSVPGIPEDTEFTHRQRMVDIWGTWARGGSSAVLKEQLEIATGYEVDIIRDPNSSSEFDFVVSVKSGTHPITNGGPILGTFVLGRPFPEAPANPVDNPQTYLGPTELLTSINYSMRRLILHWKPSIYRCTYVHFNISNSYFDGTWTFDGSRDFSETVYRMPVQV